MPEKPATAWSDPGSSASGMGAPMVAGAGALLAALQSRYYDPGWNCADPANDLRGTDDASRKTVAPIGGNAQLVLVATKLSLVSPAKSDVDVAMVPDYPGSGPVRAFVQAYAITSPAGKSSWADLNGYLAALEEPNAERSAVSSLAEPLRVELTHLVEGLAAPACAANVLTGADLDLLPFPPEKDERDLILAKMAEISRALPRICKATQRAAGPWEAHFSHLEAVYRGNSNVAKVRAKLHIQHGALCLGKPEVIKVIAVQ